MSTTQENWYAAQAMAAKIRRVRLRRYDKIEEQDYKIHL
jgi:hypothetical protein